MTAAEMASAPLGAATAGAGWAVWCATPEVCGSVLWGAPDAAAARAYAEALDFVLDDNMRRYDAIVDARGMTRADDGALALLLDYLARRGERLAPLVRSVIVVRPAAVLVGAAVAGALPLTTAWPLRVVEDLTAAARLVDGRIDGAALEAIAGAARESEGLEVRLDAVIERALPRPEIEAVAETLGISTRTLQRRVAGRGATFRALVQATRLRAAERRIVTSDEKITAIALECGFASSQHLASTLRRLRGTTPTELRARRRGDGDHS